MKKVNISLYDYQVILIRHALELYRTKFKNNWDYLDLEIMSREEMLGIIESLLDKIKSYE